MATKAQLIARIAEQDRQLIKRAHIIHALRARLSVAERNNVKVAKAEPMRIYLGEYATMDLFKAAAAELCAQHQLKSVRCAFLAKGRIAAYV